MSPAATFFLISGVLGGLAIFVFALELLARNLYPAIAAYLRRAVLRARERRWSLVQPAALCGLLLQSRQSGVVLRGYLNAGFVSQRDAVIFWGTAALGTAVAGVILSVELTPYFFILIAVGFALHMILAGNGSRVGGGLLATGLLFLAIAAIARALEDQADAVRLALRFVAGTGRAGWTSGLLWSGLLAGASGCSLPSLAVLLAVGHARLDPGLAGAVPVLMGAQAGLVMRWSLEARRHTNPATRRVERLRCLHALVLALAVPCLRPVVGWAVTDFARGTALLFLVSSFVAGLVVGAFTARGWLLPAREGEQEVTHLDYGCIDRPEQALRAVLCELHRVAEICRRSMHRAGEIMLQEEPSKLQEVRTNEEVVDEIKNAMRDYIAQISLHRLSRRQAILVQHLNRCMIDLERIGDHVANIAEISLARFHRPETIVDEETFALVYRAYQAARDVLDRVVESLQPDIKDHQEAARRILEARDAYMRLSLKAKSEISDRLAAGRFPPGAGIYLSAYISAFDRLVKHAKMIALAEQSPQFWIKESKLTRTSELLPPVALHEPIPAEDYLKRLQIEDYL